MKGHSLFLAIVTMGTILSAQQTKLQALRASAAQRWQPIGESLRSAGARAAASARHVKESFSNVPQLKACLSDGTCSSEQMKQLATVLKVSAAGAAVGVGAGLAYRHRGAIRTGVARVGELRSLNMQQLRSGLSTLSLQIMAKIFTLFTNPERPHVAADITALLERAKTSLTPAQQHDLYSRMYKVYVYGAGLSGVLEQIVNDASTAFAIGEEREVSLDVYQPAFGQPVPPPVNE